LKSFCRGYALSSDGGAGDFSGADLSLSGIDYLRAQKGEGKESLINILFGQSDATDPLRRVITFLRYSNSRCDLCRTGEPCRLHQDRRRALREELVRRLRGELIDRIDEEKAAIVGPL